MILRQRISGQKFPNAPFRNHAGGSVVRIVCVSTALTGKLGLCESVVRGFARTYRRHSPVNYIADGIVITAMMMTDS